MVYDFGSIFVFYILPYLNDILRYDTDDVERGRRRCAGLVLRAIGFIEDGLIVEDECFQ